MFPSNVWPTAGVAIKHGGVRQVAHVEARLGTSSCAKPNIWSLFHLVDTGEDMVTLARGRPAYWGSVKMMVTGGETGLYRQNNLFLVTQDHHLNLDKVGHFAWMGGQEYFGHSLLSPPALATILSLRWCLPFLRLKTILRHTPPWLLP